MNVDDAIKAVELAVQDLKTSIVDLEVAAESEFGMSPPHAILALKQRASEIVLGKVRVDVAEARRPKGPAVTVEWTGNNPNSVEAEVIRRTCTQVIVRRQGWGTANYKLSDGTPVKRGYSDYLGFWRIRESDLAKVRAMPEGENEVSRALKAITRGAGR